MGSGSPIPPSVTDRRVSRWSVVLPDVTEGPRDQGSPEPVSVRVSPSVSGLAVLVVVKDVLVLQVEEGLPPLPSFSTPFFHPSVSPSPVSRKPPGTSTLPPRSRGTVSDTMTRRVWAWESSRRRLTHKWGRVNGVGCPL